ncbi:hypothetical protein LCGC14_1189710 [marine sediment metagenome]|uniref:Uncharacterized protein n=1 Tax=marine sediment metagenome TaxID=412755 RepID=A0A0F9P2J9_9ZZZZ
MAEATVYALEGVMGELDRLSTAIEEMNNNNEAVFNRQLWNVEDENGGTE